MDPVQKISDETNIATNYQGALGFSIPPFVPFRKIVIAGKYDRSLDIEKSVSNYGDASTFSCALALGAKDDDSLYYLPVDPIISVTGKNIIVRRNVSKAKKRGSIKERWSQDDYSISISGVVTADTYETMVDYIKKIRELCEEGTKSLYVSCPILNDVYNIFQIAIEDFDFPFTPGMENQEFTLKAYSDDIYDLLVEVGNV